MSPKATTGTSPPWLLEFWQKPTEDKRLVDENNNVGASNDNCQLRRPSVEKVEAKKSRPSLRLMLTTAVVIVASGLFHLHSDKRPYDEIRDFPYPRIPLFPSACSGSSSVGRGDCVVDGVSVQDPVWSNETKEYLYMVGDENNISVLKSPKWSKVNLRRPIYLSMVVLSAPKHFDERQTVREEFNKLKKRMVSSGKRIELTFLLGAVANPSLAKLINEEHAEYADIFQISVMDSYQNLAYKTMTSYLWHSSEVGPAVDWIVKFDDDVAVDWDKLLPSFIQHSVNGTSEGSLSRISPVNGTGLGGTDLGLYCHAVLRNRMTHRPGKHVGAKLLVEDFDAYATDVDALQPPYCNGWVYILGPETGRQLALASQATPLVFIEDFYVTGVLRQRMGMPITNVGKIQPLFDDGWLKCPIFNMFRIEYLESFAFPRDEWPLITFKRTTQFVVDLVVHYIYPDIAGRI